MDGARKQRSAPLVEALLRHVRRGYARFHVPAHKGWRKVAPILARLLGSAVAAMDLTEVAALDDLHHPEGVIAEAQALAAAAFGADESYFLVNGVTAGLHAAIAAFASGGRVLVPRNAHRSVIGALVLSGAEPVWVMPEYDESTGIAGGLSAAAVAGALDRDGEVAAAVVIHPTYHGIVGDTRDIVRICHERGVPVIADEAHGAHFYFGEGYPPPALSCGVDISVAGCHKSAGAFTQAALVCAKGPAAAARADALRAWLSLLQTTSPSYILMASIDSARRLMAMEGRRRLAAALGLAREGRARIASTTPFFCPEAEWMGRPGFSGLDLTKLTVLTAQSGFDGMAVARTMLERHGVAVEFSEPRGLLAVLTYADDAASVNRLVSGLRDTCSLLGAGAPGPGGKAPASPACAGLPGIPARRMSPRDAFLAEARWADLGSAAGAAAADVVAVYPPGVPVVCPGEVIEDWVVEYLEQASATGCHCHGLRSAEGRARIRIVSGS